MNIDTFIKERVDDQVEWFSTKAKSFKRWYYILSSISVICSITAASTICQCTLFSQFTSICVAVSIGVESLCNFKDKWIIYRNTSELLKSEKIKYLMKKDITEETNQVFVDSIESIISNANNEWRRIAQKAGNRNS